MNRFLVYFQWICLHFIYLQANQNFQGEIFYPPLWQSAPVSVDDFPLVVETRNTSCNYRLIDPWFYPHRLGLYKILIDRTTPRMPFCLSSNASNILFALPSQFGWQFESNRLFTNGTLNISTNSWWASANYYLSVIPFLAAIDVGLIETNQTFRIVSVENFCSTSNECFNQVPKAMKKWHEFFRSLQKPVGIFDERTLDQHYLGPLWAAYQTSIECALPLVQSKISFLPSSAERTFGLGWSRLIRLIAMTRKNTNLYETLKNQRNFLPRRILNDKDRSLSADDLPELVRKSLKMMFSFNFDWIQVIEAIWERVTCNYEGRIYAQRTLESMAQSKIVALKYFIQAVINTLLFQCDENLRTDL